MKIRNMEAADYDRIYSLWLSCAGMGLNTLDDSRAGIEKFLMRNPDTCFVAEENDTLIGVILAGSDGRRGYIYHTAVAPTGRHQGIGNLLVKNVLTAMKAQGIHKVALVAFNKNKSGNDFWAKQGFIARDDLVYRNKALTELIRIDT